MRDDPLMVAMSSTSSARTKTIAAVANDFCLELLQASGSTHLTLATDGSVERGRRSGGAGWVSSWGTYGLDPGDTSDITVAELVAISRALAHVPSAASRVTVRSDSRVAIALARQALRSGPRQVRCGSPQEPTGRRRASTRPAKRSRCGSNGSRATPGTR